jgi:hypothetical protein
MTSTQNPQTDGVFKRAMWLFGLYTLLNNGLYILGFYFLPEGFMRRSPQVAVGGLVAQAGSFWSELVLTLFFNLVLMSGLVIVLNLNRVKGFPVGYLIPISLGITAGLISGTNSFAASDLTHYNAWEGMALGLSFGGLEMLAYVLVVAATANLTMYQYRSWWRWSGEWKATRVRGFRELRLTRPELLPLGIAGLLLLIASYRETNFALAV